MKFPRERIAYSPIDDRPPLRLPGGARLVVWPVVNIEEWELTRAMARQASGPPMGVPQIPDFPNWTWHEYGMRVGFWRLKRALDDLGVRATMSLNAKVCETCPAVPRAALDANWEIMAHCVVQMPINQIEDQRAMIRESVALIEKFSGRRPRGWLGPGRSQTYRTVDYVKEAGLEYFADWILDDQPLEVQTAHGPIVSIPYTVELNDITVNVAHMQPSDGLKRRIVDAFDQMYAESATSARIMAIGVHPYVTGAAHRVRYFREALEYAAGHKGVLFWTGEEILDWYLDERKNAGRANPKRAPRRAARRAKR